MSRDALTPHLARMHTLNAGGMEIKLGDGKVHRADIRFQTVRGRIRVTNKLTGRAAFVDEPAARAALVAEIGPWLEFFRLRIRWEIAKNPRARAAAGRAFLTHLLNMARAATAAGEAQP